MSGYTIVIDYGDSEDTYSVRSDHVPPIGAQIVIGTAEGTVRNLVVESIRYEARPSADGGYQSVAPYVFCNYAPEKP